MHRGQLGQPARLQDAGAVDHRVDAGEARPPRGRIGVAHHVARDPRAIGKAPPRRIGAARAADYVMARRTQCGEDVGADEAVAAGDQDAHGSSPQRPEPSAS